MRKPAQETRGVSRAPDSHAQRSLIRRLASFKSVMDEFKKRCSYW